MSSQEEDPAKKSEEDSESEEEEEDAAGEESSDDGEFDDPENYVDAISDAELLGDLLKEKPVEETGVDNIIVVDNAPKVGQDRMDKLKNVLTKVFSRFGEIVTQYYPTDENGIFKGYFFLEFATPEGAANAVEAGNGYKLDKSHVFAVNFFTDFDKYADLPEKWEPPNKKPFTEIGNLRSWLLDENCYDQCAIIYNGGVGSAIAQITPQEARVVTERLHWTDTYLRWSPHGTYLATFHKQGVALWGGEKFSRQGKFEHEGVQLIDFCPRERYLVTFSNVVDDPNNPQNIIVWDIKTGTKKRTFKREQLVEEETWPIIKWSHDGKYFGQMAENLLRIYETPSFGLLDKKSIIIKGIRDFSWSPTEHRISYWVPETTTIPAKITVIKIPSREEISTKSRHLVSDCKMHWQKQGDYLCVKVDYWMTKSRKQLCYSFEIFHMREALIPVDNIDMKGEPVLNFALEPRGSKFAVIHGEPPTRIFASLYKINDKGAKVSKIKTLDRMTANHVFWSPSGQFVVFAGLKGMDGHMEFWDTENMTLMNHVEHTMATDLEWDPTGRYVVTSISYWSQKMDTGFIVWSFQGRLLYRNPVQMDKFCQLLWRPRPPSLLTEEDIKNVRRDYKKYQHTFEQKDRSIRTKASKDLIEKRQKLIKEFTQFRKRKDEEWKQKREEFFAPLETVGSDNEEETLDVLLKETQETLD